MLLMMTPVVALSAWIACGPERTAYFGWQLAFAFFICTLHGIGPNYDITLVRDRIVGILIGIAVMGVVFHYIWPERAQLQVRAHLLAALRSSASMIQQPAPTASTFAACRHAALTDIANAERIAGLAAFEGAGLTQELVAAVRLAASRGLYFAQLNNSQSDDPAALDPLSSQVAGMLREAVDALEEMPSMSQSARFDPLPGIFSQVGAAVESGQRMMAARDARDACAGLIGACTNATGH
jgi:multidrug resistance protein MdtO